MLRLLITLALLRRVRLLGDLVVGAQTRTQTANRGLEALADRVRADPSLKGGARRPERRSGRFARVPRLPRRPHDVPRVDQVLADRPPPPAPADRADHALACLVDHPMLRWAPLRRRIVRWVEAARSGVAFREDTDFYFTKPLPVLRRALLEMGRRLCVAGA